MPPEHARSFGGGLTETALSPIVVVALALAIILLLLLPRKYAVYPLFVLVLLVTLGQQLIIFGVHLYIFRILILFGCFRILWAKLTSQARVFVGGINSIDRAFFWCVLVQAIAVVLLSLNSEAVINQVAFLLDSLGGYFLLRYLIQDEKDICRTVKCFAVLALILGVCMMREQFTLNNIFSLIGGHGTPEIREGRIRLTLDGVTMTCRKPPYASASPGSTSRIP